MGKFVRKPFKEIPKGALFYSDGNRLSIKIETMFEDDVELSVNYFDIEKKQFYFEPLDYIVKYIEKDSLNFVNTFLLFSPEDTEYKEKMLSLNSKGD